MNQLDALHHILDNEGLLQPTLGLSRAVGATLPRVDDRLLLSACPRTYGQQTQGLTTTIARHRQREVRAEAIPLESTTCTLATKHELRRVVHRQHATVRPHPHRCRLNMRPQQRRRLHARVVEEPVGRFELRTLAQRLRQAQLCVARENLDEQLQACLQTLVIENTPIELTRQRARRGRHHAAGSR